MTPVESNQEWALSDWISENDEDSVLAAVLQQSAQEFFNKECRSNCHRQEWTSRNTKTDSSGS